MVLALRRPFWTTIYHGGVVRPQPRKRVDRLLRDQQADNTPDPVNLLLCGCLPSNFPRTEENQREHQRSAAAGAVDSPCRALT